MEFLVNVIFPFPGWAVSLAILIETSVLLYTHKFSLVDKLMVALPAFVVASMYTYLDFVDAPLATEVRSVGRLSLFLWFLWTTILLWNTRRRH